MPTRPVVDGAVVEGCGCNSEPSREDMALVGKYYKSVRRAVDDESGKQQAAL